MVGCSILSTQEYHRSIYKDISGTAFPRNPSMKYQSTKRERYKVHAEYLHRHPIIDEYYVQYPRKIMKIMSTSRA
jgi:hypothetical protein